MSRLSGIRIIHLSAHLAGDISGVCSQSAAYMSLDRASETANKNIKLRNIKALVASLHIEYRFTRVLREPGFSRETGSSAKSDTPVHRFFNKYMISTLPHEHF